MRTVVTGAAGFVGSLLVEKLLARGDEVVCIERPGGGKGWLEGLDIPFHDCGLDDPAALKEIICPADTVFHLAALTEARAPEDYYRVNTRGTAHLLKAAGGCSQSPPKLVFMSSLAAVGPAPKGGCIEADKTPEPLSHYGRSKLQAEAAIHAFSDRVPAVICRCPAVYGPRDRVVLALFNMVARGFAMTVGPWDRQVSVVHVDDVTDGLLAAADTTEAVGRTYNLAHPEPITWGQFVTAVGRAVGRNPRRLAVPVGVARSIAVAAETAAWLSRRAAVFNRERVRELAQESWVCDVEATVRELGFHPRYPLETGVAATAVWLRRNQWI